MNKVEYKQNFLFVLVKTVVRLFYTKYSMEMAREIPADKPVVFLCNHLKIQGPTVILLYFPFKYRAWVIHDITKIRSCIKYLENLFVANVLKIKKRPFSLIAAFFLALFCTWVMRSNDVIGAYRGTHRAMLTFEETERCIKKGQNILIFPEKNDTPYDDKLHEFYAGFAHLGKKIFADTKMEIDFYPVFIHKKAKKIMVLEKETFDGNNSFKLERKRLVDAVKSKMDAAFALYQPADVKVNASKKPLV